MKNWDTLEADENLILTKHYSGGRMGRRINKVILHHNGGNLSIRGCYDVWQTREASAHYQVDAQGRIGQLVWDSDTAWHAGNLEANLTSIGIEHADISNSPWRISDLTLNNGAHLTAAVCKHYGLGRPQYGRNVFFHKDFSPTECPASIAGSQRAKYLERAGYWYDVMTGRKPTASKPAVKPTIDKEIQMGTTHIIFKLAGSQACYIANILAGTYQLMPNMDVLNTRKYVLQKAGAKVKTWREVCGNKGPAGLGEVAKKDLPAFGVEIK